MSPRQAMGTNKSAGASDSLSRKEGLLTASGHRGTLRIKGGMDVIGSLDIR